MVETASLYDNFCKTGNDVIYDVIIWPIIDTYKTAKIHSVTSRAVDIIHSFYYIHGP